MVKILSKSGDSLADIYDVEGSIAGIEQLETRDLPIMHEMGATVFSERFNTRIFRIASAARAQNVAFTVEIATLPETPCRLLGVQCIADDVTELTRFAVTARDPTLQQDIPVWAWDGSNSVPIRLTDLTLEADFDLLTPALGFNVPTFMGGREQQGPMVSSVTITGLTAGFGAGTTRASALLLMAFPLRDINISSKGLPIPSW